MYASVGVGVSVPVCVEDRSLSGHAWDEAIARAHGSPLGRYITCRHQADIECWMA